MFDAVEIEKKRKFEKNTYVLILNGMPHVIILAYSA
jgi:hypothetical protein